MKLSFFLLAIVLVQVFDRVTPEPVPKPLLGLVGAVVNEATQLTGSVLQNLVGVLNPNIANSVKQEVAKTRAQLITAVLQATFQIVNGIEMPLQTKSEILQQLNPAITNAINAVVNQAEANGISVIQAAAQSALANANIKA